MKEGKGYLEGCGTPPEAISKGYGVRGLRFSDQRTLSPLLSLLPVSLAVLPDDPFVITLAVVTLSLGVVIILFLSYFHLLKEIASFSYCNARFKAVGVPYVRRDELRRLYEERRVDDMAAALLKKGYRLPSTSGMTVRQLEDAMLEERLRMAKSTLAAVPEGLKPFVRAWLVRLDGEEVKRALHQADRGERVEVRHVYLITPEVAGRLRECGSPEEVVDALDGTPYRDVLREVVSSHRDSPGLWDMAVDHVGYQVLYHGVGMVDEHARPPVSLFYGRMADIRNILAVARGMEMGMGEDDVKRYLAPGGRELARWRLDRLWDAKDLPGLFSSLEDTTYGRMLKEAKTVADAERLLESYLLSAASELSARYSLGAGPALFFLLGKEMEVRNVIGVARGVSAGMEFEEILGDLTVLGVRG
ncbi:MAG: V-type ATPase subunit [Thermoplasmata archaeon]|nr:V-type ATPase subunit [Thermoplasmata archaeon]